MRVRRAGAAGRCGGGRAARAAHARTAAHAHTAAHARTAAHACTAAHTCASHPCAYASAGLLHANVFQAHQQPVFVAVNSTTGDGRAVIYYAQIVLCLVGTYLNAPCEIVYVRWLHTARAIARAAGRELSDSERRGPFESFRWAPYPAMRYQQVRYGHPRAGDPWYGAVSPSQIMYRVHMVRSMDDPELLRLNTDVWLQYL